MADSRALPVEAETVDLVLSSPPYCTRIDYVVSTSFELAALGLPSASDDFSNLRRATMGTPLTRADDAAGSGRVFPLPVDEVLERIREHKSKSSKSYYHRTYRQYFSDALASVRELQRVIRPGGVAILVVQSSYYKDILVDLPELYLSMGRHCGMKSSIVGETKVRRAMSQINPHTARYRSSSNYREAVVALEKAS